MIPGVAIPSFGRGAAALVFALALVGTLPGTAAGHTGGQAFILLLPTHLYVAGGAIVVAISFALVVLLPARAFHALERARVCLRLPAPPREVRPRLSAAASLASLALVLVLVAAGLTGSRDPLSNPLPLFVWTVWWIGFTYLVALAGNLWAHVNPWSGLHHVATALPALRRWRTRPPLVYPSAVGHWPAVAFFLAFAWLELIHPAPADPAVLAGAVLAYLLAQFTGVFLFGPGAWLHHAEPFSVLFRMVSWLAPAGAADAPADRHGPGARRGNAPGTGGPPGPAGPRAATAPPTAGGRARPPVERRVPIVLTLPGLRLLDVPPPPPSAIAFILLALSCVSFDGLSRTFTWLGFLGVNPLDHPGRTALMLPNTVGLLATFAALSLAYAAAVVPAARLAGVRQAAPRAPGGLAGLFVLSIIPIAYGYHFAHYLPVLIVDGQYAVRAASDPFALGWDLLGTRDLQVVVSWVTAPDRIYAIWHAQVAIIVAAHVAAVLVAHVLALRVTSGAPSVLRGQLPLLALMIGYTMLGLWLLSTPAAG